MSKTPKTPNIVLRGEMQAKITGASRGTDISLIVLGAICLIGTLGCFWLSLWISWAVVGAVAFLAGFGFVLYVWRTGTEARMQQEAPVAQLSWRTERDEVAISMPLDSQNYIAKRMLSGMRAVVQSRGTLPTPRGVVTGSPADGKALREYGDDECRLIEEGWAREVAKHDALVVEKLNSAVRSLESGTSDSGKLSQNSEVNSKGIRQINPPETKT